MPVFCPHCQAKFSSLTAVKLHQPTSKRCQKNVLKSNLITDCGLKCTFDCCSKSYKNKASLLFHYKNNCVKITLLQKSILFPFSNNIIDNDPDANLSNGSYNEAVGLNDNVSSLLEINNSLSRLPAERILFSIGLKFYSQYGIFNCTECNSIIGKSYLDHARRAHKMPHLNSQQKNTVSIFVNDSISLSPYFLKSNILLDPIHFIKINDGFRCNICPYYCKSEYSKQKHIKQHSETNSMTPCKVQTIAGEGSKKKIYFGVKALSLDLDIENFTFEETNEASLPFQLAKSELIEKIIVRPKFNRFYSKLGWWHDEDIDNEMKESYKLMNNLSSDPEEMENFNLIRNAYTLMIKKILSIKYSIRAIFAKKDSTNVLEPLQYGESYSHLFAKMLVFFGKVRTMGRYSNLFDESTNDLLDKVIGGNIGIDFKNLIDLGLIIIRQKYNNSNIFFLELFLKVNCFNRDGSLLKCAEFERTCSKIIFFCKLTLAFSIHFSIGENTNFLISESRELLNSPNLSFVSVCGLKALAKSFNDCNNNVPKLISGKEETEVWCNGESISIIEIRTVYQNSLVDLEKLMKKLLFGQSFRGIKIHDDWNNLSIGYGLSFYCENEEDLSCILLNYAYKNSNFFCKDTFIPDSKALHNFKIIHDNFINILICAMHIGGGMPARATELESIQVINSDLIS